ncbi:hypothetical protein PV328_007662 [Microctonus aethiopoides]|uniref:Uncharacterized protein n=1 Tax=Microctonus aethiopoides TaxID=144406 RepID=A0AA39C9T4_9HYME|nr:hypothetical protein PV328_007662 [Microctonus aethiopoides]
MACHITSELEEPANKFLRYLKNYWGRMPEILSVAGHTSRTNNICESFNRQLPQKLQGPRPTFINFLEPGECVAGYESRILGDQISTVGCESSSIEKTNREDADLKISECNVINNDQQNLVCVDPEKNQDESSRASFTGTNSTNNRDSDYVPSREITLNNSHLSSDDSLVKLNKKAFIDSHLSKGPPMDVEIKKINKKVTDLASVFRAKRFESLLQAVKVCANYDETNKIYKMPANATTLGIQLKKCCGILKSDYAKKEYVEGLNRVEGFLNVFNDEFNVAVTRKALEDQTTIRRNKKIVLPSQEDISKLYMYLKERCENAMVVLKEKFDVSAGTQLSESVVILLIMFNRRRPGESERFLSENYRNQEKIDDALNLDMYSKVSKESQKQSNQFVRIVCREKLGRTVAVLMHKFLLTYIDKILEYRKEARVSSSNPYLFAVPSDK